MLDKSSFKVGDELNSSQLRQTLIQRKSSRKNRGFNKQRDTFR